MKRWPTKMLGEVADVFNGKTPAKTEQRACGHPVLKIRDVDEEGNFRGRHESFVDSKFAEANMKKKVHASDVLILNAAHNADYVASKIFFAGEEVAGTIATGEWTIIRANPTSLNPGFVHHLVRSQVGRTSIKNLVRGIHLYPSDVASVRLPVPPLAEQERIVKLLDEGDELRKRRAQADRRTADLIPALFNETFGGATPANTRWPFKALGAVGKVVTGNTPSRKVAEYYGTFVEWVKTDNINALAGRVERAAEALSTEGAKCGRVVPAGSVLMTCIAGSRDRIGDAAVSDREVAINQQINAIIPNSESDAIFLCEVIRALKPEIQRRATGVMTGIINKSSLEQIESISPPLSVQKEFGSKVTEIRMMQADQAASRQRLDDLLQSMLHRAFAGEL